MADFSPSGDLISLYAPGAFKESDGTITGIECASGTTNGRQKDEGTSYAAPTVAGLAAYFMSIMPDEWWDPGNVAYEVKLEMSRRAHPRNGGPARAIYNGFDYRDGNRATARRARERRAEVVAEPCSMEASSTWSTWTAPVMEHSTMITPICPDGYVSDDHSTCVEKCVGGTCYYPGNDKAAGPREAPAGPQYQCTCPLAS